MKINFKYKLGTYLKDRQGFTGRAVQATVHVNGCIQYDITPETVNNEYKSGYFIDEQSLERADNSIQVKGFSHDFQFEVGESVKHKASGQVGIVTGLTVTENGCEKVAVTTSHLNQITGQPAVIYGFSMEFVKKGEKANLFKKENDAFKAEPKKERTGCERMRSEMIASGFTRS